MRLRKNGRSFPVMAVPIFLLSLFAVHDKGLSGDLGRSHRDNNLSKVVIGYYAGWARADYGHLKIDYSALTYITHACAWPDSEGNLFIPDDYLYPELVQTAHENGVEMILMVGGWGNCDGFPGMASTAANRHRFVTQAVDFCRVQGYDGVDIDWEFVSNDEERQNFSLFIKELSTALHGMNPPRVLTMAAPSEDYYGRWINYEELHPYFDFIGFMTYDYHGSWTDHSGHNSPLYTCDGDTDGSVDATFAYARERQVPLEKLLLGIPFYGRSYDSRGLYQSFTTTGEYAFSEIVEYWYEGWGYHWDDCAKVPYLTNPTGVGVICFDDPFSVYWKCAYVLDKGAAGVIIWELSEDGFRGQNILIKAVGQAFQR
jgi:chitinase